MPRQYTKKSNYWEKLKSIKNESVESLPNNSKLSEHTTEPQIGGEGLESIAALGGGSSSYTKNIRIGGGSDIVNILEYANIRAGLLPYEQNGTNISLEETIELCQKAYANVAVFRNAIEILTEFSSSPIHLKSSNEAAVNFYKVWLEKINITALKDQFFREWYRSGNVFIYSFDGVFNQESLRLLKRSYDINSNTIPARYVILNPARIAVETGSFYDSTYVKMLSKYEIQAIKAKRTDQAVALYNSLDPKTRAQIDSYNGAYASTLFIKLDPKKVRTAFYKKQDYEPLAIPMGFPILNDIEWKLMMQKMDMSLTRILEHAFLLITTGDPEKGVNPNNVRALADIFKNNVLGRTVVHDYSTKAEWIIPEISQLLGPEKYKIVNDNIKEGLHSLLMGEEKFGNAQIKAEVFLQRLESSREAFLKNFLIPEMENIAKVLNFKTVPVPEFEKVKIQDPINLQRLYIRLAELGVLTPEDTIKAIEDGILPDLETLARKQEEYKKQREEGLFYPLVGGSRPSGENGRPQGTGTPKTVNTVSRVAKAENFSKEKLLYNTSLLSEINSSVESGLKKKYNLESLNENQLNMARILSRNIFVNESNPLEVVASYIENPQNISLDAQSEIDDIILKYEIDEEKAILLYKSRL